MNHKRIIAAVIEILLGIALAVLGTVKLLDSFWTGMGTALVFVGGIALIRTIRYKINPNYKEAIDTEINDERNRFLSTKAWSWAGYLYVMIAAVATIAFKLLGHEELMMLSSFSICLILLLY